MKSNLILFELMFVISSFLLMGSTLYADLETVNYDKNLTIVTGGGGNSGILVTDDAVFVIDTKMGKEAEDLYKLVKEKAGQKPIIVINTHYHRDHVGGNKFYKGSKIYIGNYDKKFLKDNISEENMPTDFIKDSLILNVGKETVVIYNIGQAHTWQDLIVYLKDRKLLFTGDIIFNSINPVLKKESGANVDSWMKNIDIIPSKLSVTTYVPGHGQTGGKEIVDNLRQYFVDMNIAATYPEKVKEIVTKYSKWITMPSMASPEATINYIKSK